MLFTTAFMTKLTLKQRGFYYIEKLLTKLYFFDKLKHGTRVFSLVFISFI